MQFSLDSFRDWVPGGVVGLGAMRPGEWRRRGYTAGRLLKGRGVSGKKLLFFAPCFKFQRPA